MSKESDGPMQSAQRAMRPVLPKRFYKQVRIAERDGVFALELDGRVARTPAKRLLALPSRPLGDAVAAEWAAVTETIDPARMPLTRLVNIAIDRVADNPADVIDEVVNYAGSDLVCYRASEPEGLVEAQNAVWNPVLDWAHDVLGARFQLSEGVRYVEQEAAALAAVRADAEKISRPFALAALASATNLTGSALIPLALARGAISSEQAWQAAHVDEDWQISQWGEDDDAKLRREFRKLGFEAAARVFQLSR